jgi:drug/metabolite transporter (DMT)-like permease
VAAVLGGGGSALAWALSTLCTARASRMISPWSVVAWVTLTGLVVTVPLVVERGGMAHASAHTWALLVVSGASNVGGLVVAYRAYRTGAIALVAPIISTEGAIAAVIAIVLGESVGVSSVVALAVIAVGVVLATTAPSVAEELHGPVARRAAMLGLSAAAIFAIGLYTTGQVADDAPSIWVTLSARAVGAVTVALPLLVARRLELTRRALPLVVTAGLCEVAGALSYVAGARDDVAVAAVLSSQFAAIVVVVSWLAFGERLSRLQGAGVGVVVVGVSVLAALS